MAEPSAKRKRQVKNPETFRERAIKAGQDSEQPKRATLVRQGFTSTAKKAATPVTRPLSKAAAAKPLKPVRTVLRLIGRIVFPTYFRRSWQELKLVSWPSWQQSRQLTFAVLIFAIVFGALIAGLDYGLDKVFRQVLLK